MLLSYHSDPEFKRKFVGIVRRHQDEDRLVRGVYGEVLVVAEGERIAGRRVYSRHGALKYLSATPGSRLEWRGCAIGCAMRSILEIQGREHLFALEYGLRGLGGAEMDDIHGVVADGLGIPRDLALLVDWIFEGLLPEQARQWPLLFAEALPLGLPLDSLVSQLAAELVATYGVDALGHDFTSYSRREEEPYDAISTLPNDQWASGIRDMLLRALRALGERDGHV